MNFLAELKRRNVVRMAGLYLVGAWLIVQVAATLLPVFEAPSWVMKTLVGLLVIGFILTLVISWVFELTLGSTLGVAHVLEGSVRKQGSPLRITALANGRMERAVCKIPCRPAASKSLLTVSTAMGLRMHVRWP